MKNFLLILLLVLTSASLLCAQEKATKPIIFITDASGSMWQKVKGEFKIQLAREVLGNLVGEMPEDQPLGLVAYGHRQKSDCSDIEELLPPGNMDKIAFQEALKELNPLGMTPLAQSASMVIDQLKSNGESATIILITDGVETCQGELCQVVKEAKEAGVDFVLHIIGFDLGDANRAPLECAAREGEGLYLDASDKDQLEDAVQQSSDLKVDTPKGKLSIKSLRNDELIDAVAVVYQKGTDEDIAAVRSYSTPETNPALLNIPAGTYDLEVTVVGQQAIAPLKRNNIVVTEAEVNEQVFDFTSGKVEITVLEAGALHDATINVLPHGQRKAVASGRTYKADASNPFKKEMNPGIYDIVIKSVTIKGIEQEHVIEKIEVRPGQTTELSHEFESAVLRVGAFFQDQLSDVTVSIRSLNSRQSVAAGRTYTSPDTNPKQFVLSPGTYEVEVNGIKVPGNPKEKWTITLKAGEEAEKIIKW